MKGLGKPEALKHNWTGYCQGALTGNTGLFINESVKNNIAQLRSHY